MTRPRGGGASRLALVLPAALALAACDQLGLGGGRSSAAAGAGAGTPAAPAAPAPVPVPDSHPVHRQYGGRSGPEAAIASCATCHSPHFGLFTVREGIVLPGGTSTDGGQAFLSGSVIACQVACHYPFGAEPRTVTWGETTGCAGCHTTVRRTGTDRRSSHDPIFADQDPASGQVRAPATAPDPTWCGSCHAAADAEHAGGTPRLRPAADRDAVCLDCHAGRGQTLRGAAGPGYLEKTAPVLSTYALTTSGDWHGARAGTGYGGTLRAPYVRGQPALPCQTCHAGHESGNPWLLAAVVNGTPIPAGSIARSGVGAERLCEACHQGDRHATCRGCHTAAHDPEGGFDPAAPPVDPMPAGSPCFFCHGHEGIRNWTAPVGGSMSGPPLATGCKHCHGMPSPTVNPGVAPTIVAERPSDDVPFYSTPSPPVYLLPGGTPYAIGARWATIWWQTTGNATSWVEWGVGTAGFTATADMAHCDPAFGTPCRSFFHKVSLSNLQPGTTYVFRVRSTDDYRNTVEGPLSTFTTPAADAPPAPTLLHQPDVVGSIYGPAELQGTLAWNPSVAPSGALVTYRVQLSTDPTFTAPPLLDSDWIEATGLPFTVTAPAWPLVDVYAWRVMARDSSSFTLSPWTTRDGFSAWRYDPYDY